MTNQNIRESELGVQKFSLLNNNKYNDKVPQKDETINPQIVICASPKNISPRFEIPLDQIDQLELISNQIKA